MAQLSGVSAPHACMFQATHEEETEYGETPMLVKIKRIIWVRVNKYSRPA
jgi:hypothetical protein